MKRIVLLISVAALALFASSKVSAQGKFCPDSAECIKYLSYYTEYFKQKNYGSALNWFSRFVNEGSNGDRQVLADAYNRMGDCNFYARKFDDARRSYDKAEQVDPSLGDYSLYQEGFVKGLQRDYNGKIQSLNQLITNYPQSQ